VRYTLSQKDALPISQVRQRFLPHTNNTPSTYQGAQIRSLVPQRSSDYNLRPIGNLELQGENEPSTHISRVGCEHTVCEVMRLSVQKKEVAVTNMEMEEEASTQDLYIGNSGSPPNTFSLFYLLSLLSSLGIVVVFHFFLPGLGFWSKMGINK